jgi:2'-5' RNA ligase
MWICICVSLRRVSRTARVDLTENSSMEEPGARGISLWLMPEGEEHDRLSALIGRLAERFATASFAPHVTLLPGVPGPEREVLAIARVLAAETTPIPVDFSVVDGLEHHFRCLFLRAHPRRALRDAHERAARRFGREPQASFDPHLSLLYGSLAAPVKAALVRELAGEATTHFDAHALHVWRTQGAVGEWRPLGSFAFVGDD